MAYSFSENFIQNLLARADIVSLVQDRVQLRKAGGNYIGLCPFHKEKTPSFSVNATKQFYHCFGCGASGDAIQFLIEHDGMHFVNAVEYLANQCGIELPKKLTTNKDAAPSIDLVYQVIEEATEIFAKNLRNGQLAAKAVSYLKSRAITGQTAKLFRLGYADNSWNSLLNKTNASFSLEILQRAGLVVQREQKKAYDVFRDRIVFPIINSRGRVVGFGGRVIDQGQPKYLNSKDGEAFNKSQELYGLFQAKKANRSLNSLIIVEGYMDVIALHQAGINNAVATLGTAITKAHIQKILSLVNEIIFCFDADAAGKRAAWKAVEMCLPELRDNLLVRILFLPDGEDPDSFINQYGVSEFKIKIKQALSLVDFLFEELAKDLDLDLVDEKIIYADRIKNYIKMLPNKGIYQQMLHQRLEQILGMDLQATAQSKNYSMAKHSGFKHSKSTNAFHSTKPSNLSINDPAFFILAILLKNRTLLSLFFSDNEVADYDVPGCELLVEVVKILIRQPDISVPEIREQLPVHLAKKLDIQRLRAIARIVPEDGMEPELLGAVKRLKQFALENNLDRLLEKARAQGLTPSEKSLMQKLLLERVE